MGWTIFFFFVVLKIPVLAALYILWWAVRQEVEVEPDQEDDEERGPGGGSARPRKPRPRPPRRGPHEGPRPQSPHRSRKPAVARTLVRR